MTDHIEEQNSRKVSEERLREILAAAGKATPGPWDIWTEPAPSKDRAIDELAYQVTSIPDADFAEAVYLLNANGKCPATTGCGPTSAANAAFLANCDPQTISALVSELLALRTPKEAGEAVAWQHRSKLKWQMEWSPWADGRETGANTNDFDWEVRPLFASPSLAVSREAVIDEAIAEIEAFCNFGDYKREELTADFGQPKFDQMHDIIKQLRLLKETGK